MRRCMLSLALAWLLGASIDPAEAGGGRSAMNSSWVTVPGKAVGPIRIGMSQEEVRATVGEPERSSLGPWEYLSGGYALTFSSTRHTVNSILGGDVGYP